MRDCRQQTTFLAEPAPVENGMENPWLGLLFVSVLGIAAFLALDWGSQTAADAVVDVPVRNLSLMLLGR